MCGSKRRAVDIPSDLLEEILHRLRSNDLLNFKLVCKDWERLISSPGLIQKHLKRSNVGYYPPRILVPCDDCDGDYDDDITIGKILDCADTTNTTKRIPLCYDVTFLGSCDGLVLYQEYDGVIGALNLSTGKYEVRTPNPSIDKVLNIKTLCTWFGHHPSTGEYVLVLANPYDSEEGDGANKPRRRVVFEVHSLSRNDTGHSLLSSSTRELDWDFDLQTWLGSHMYGPNFNPRRFGCHIYHNVGAFLRGRVHCPVPVSPRIYGDYRAEILAYDLEANDIIRMPTPLESCDGLGVHDGRLIALHSTAVWVMKEYGVEESWTKYAKIPFYGLLHASFSPHGDIFCVDKNFYYDDDCDLTMYFLPAKKTVTVRANVGYTWRSSCIGGIDSLVSPALVWTK